MSIPDSSDLPPACGEPDHIWTSLKLEKGDRVMDPDEGVRRAAEQARGVRVTFLEMVPVVETFRGKVVWEGFVSVFDSQGGGVYAWAIDGEEERQFIAVLDQRPIDSPVKAVRAWLSSKVRR